MRIAILSTILTVAATLAACSGGGGGPLDISPLDLGREPVSDGTFGSPYETPPNRGASITTQEPTTKTPKTPTTDNHPPTSGFDASVSDFDAGSRFDARVTSIDASVRDAGATCADLDACCSSMDAGTMQTNCNDLVINNDNPSCRAALTGYKNSGFCI